MQTFEFIAQQEDAGRRIDQYVTLAANISRSMVQKLAEQGNVSVNGALVTKNYKLRTADKVVLLLPSPIQLDTKAQDIPLDIVYEDEHLVVVNKQKGMVVHPAPGNLDNTLVNALLYHCKGNLSGIGGVQRPGIVHRIDRYTSGLLVVAKNDIAHNCLAMQMKAHSVERIYHAVAYGKFKEEVGVIDAPIGRHVVDRKKMCVTEKNSRNAITGYNLITQYDGFAHLALKLETGRTHQIRVHLSYIGHPIAGDEVYGPAKVIKALNGQCLHAKTLGFIHPISREKMEFDSPLPEYFANFLLKL